MSYTVKDAKDQLSHIIRLAEKGQPQVIRRHEKDVAVVVSIEDWKKVNGKQETLLEFLQRSPLDAILDDIDNRPQDLPREVSFE